MADLINEPKKNTMALTAALIVVGGGLVGIIGFTAFKMMTSMSSSQKNKSATIIQPRAIKFPFDLTAQYYCYSQLSNFPADFYQLFLNQEEVQISGNLMQLSGQAGSFTGNLDTRGNLQFELTQVQESGGLLPSIPGLSGILGGGKTTTIFSFLGHYEHSRSGNRIAGIVINRSAAGGTDAKPRRFYCDTNRPAYWGKN